MEKKKREKGSDELRGTLGVPGPGMGWYVSINHSIKSINQAPTHSHSHYRKRLNHTRRAEDNRERRRESRGTQPDRQASRIENRQAVRQATEWAVGVWPGQLEPQQARFDPWPPCRKCPKRRASLYITLDSPAHHQRH